MITPENHCRGKRAFDSRAYAKKFMKWADRKHRRTGKEKMNVYRCQFCNSYHIGHMADWKRTGTS